ncbi:hypothetical protein GCM10009534_28350 [Kribbella sandramycini]|nr:DUF6463 family protein [Kribbella sandramycini]
MPTLTTSLGVIHLIWVVADLPDEVTGMLADGVVGASNTDSRDFATWFFIGGLVLLMIGSTMRWFVRQIGRIPTRLGWWMFALGVFDTLLEPDGGGYAQILLGVLILAALPIEVDTVPPVVDTRRL